MWPIAAPASQQRPYSSATSSGRSGSAGCCARVTSAPTPATVMTSASLRVSPRLPDPLRLLVRGRHDAGARGARDDLGRVEHPGGRAAALRWRDDPPRLEAHPARRPSDLGDLRLDLEVVAAVDRRQEVDRAVGAEEAFVAVEADQELG